MVNWKTNFHIWQFEMEISLSPNSTWIQFYNGWFRISRTPLACIRKEDNMSKQIKGNHKHLTQDDRIYIEKSLDLKMPFREIAKYLMKDPTTISKEVRLHRRLKPRNPFNQENNCTRRIKCSLKNICGTGECGQMLCKGCPMCNERCVEFEAIRCRMTDKAP